MLFFLGTCNLIKGLESIYGGYRLAARGQHTWSFHESRLHRQVEAWASVQVFGNRDPGYKDLSG